MVLKKRRGSSAVDSSSKLFGVKKKVLYGE